MKSRIKKTDISSVAPFFLFAFFAICVVTVLLIGVKLYRNQSERDINGYSNRTVSQYITTRIRQGDKYDSFFVGDFKAKLPKSKGDTFFFTETLGDAEYYTCIYCYDGYLCELFAPASEEFDPTAGERIVEVNDVVFTDNGHTLTVDITYKDNSVRSLILYLRSQRGE